MTYYIASQHCITEHHVNLPNITDQQCIILPDRLHQHCAHMFFLMGAHPSITQFTSIYNLLEGASRSSVWRHVCFIATRVYRLHEHTHNINLTYT